jgi:hypothetical protein
MNGFFLRSKINALPRRGKILVAPGFNPGNINVYDDKNPVGVQYFNQINDWIRC